MKYLTFLSGGEERAGVLSADGRTVYPLEAFGLKFASMLDFLQRRSPQDEAAIRAGLASPMDDGLPLEAVVVEAPIPQPPHDILCAGKNYTGHAREVAEFSGEDYKKPAFPVYFSKRVHRAVAPNATIPAHADITEQMDYEAELAVVFGKECAHVQPEDVYGYIFGYTIVNDVSARDIQRRHTQYTFGKSLDGAAPMGPYIVTTDEFLSPPHLAVQTRVNGEVRQDSNTRDFIFDIGYMVSQLSAGITFYPGDILITGTPSGVGMGCHPPRYLHIGDVIECEIEGIGILRNTLG